MKLDWSKLGDEVRALTHAQLHKLSAHVNAEIYARNREAEHYAHAALGVSDNPNCEVCRNAARTRRDT